MTRSVTFRATVSRIRSYRKVSETIEPFSLQGLNTHTHIQSGFSLSTVGISPGIFVLALRQIYNREMLIEEKAF